MRNLIAVLLICITACNSSKIPKASPEFFSLLNKEKNFSNTKVKLNGYYSLDPAPKGNPKISGPLSPVIFYGNGVIYHEQSNFMNEKNLSVYLTNKGLENISWNEQGTFDISHDTIYAILFCRYNKNNANIYTRELAFFRGIVRGDSILNWKMMKPYPPAPYKYPDFNEKIIERDTTPKTLYYHHFPSKTVLDSNKLYVNEYRNKPTVK